MEKWIDIAGKNGSMALILLAIGWFIYKKLWPVIEERLKSADLREKENLQRWEDQGKRFTEALKQEREENGRRFDEQGRMFMESLRTQNVLAAETHNESMKAYSEIARELKTLNHRLRNGNGK